MVLIIVTDIEIVKIITLPQSKIPCQKIWKGRKKLAMLLHTLIILI